MARSHGSCPSRKTSQEAEVLQRKFVRKQRAKRFRSNSYGLPASSLLLLAWRLKKNGAAPQQGRFNRASASEPCFRPEVETTAGARKSTPGSPKPQRGHAKQGARQGGTEPGTTRFRETDARPLGHQPRGGAPPRPRPTRRQEAPT